MNQTELKAVLVDNEEDIRQGLRAMIEAFCPQVRILAEANGVKTALEVIHSCQPNLIFLDVEMDDGTGFDLLQQLPNRTEYQVIFVTSHDRYAIDAFKFSAIDYLLKPIDPDDLEQAIEKAEERLSKDLMNQQLTVLLGNMRNSKKEKIVLKDSESIHVVKVTDIIRCEAEGSYTKFFLTDDKKLMVSKNLKLYENLLSDHDFYRPHHSHLVNLQHVVRFDRADGGMLIMSDQEIVPLVAKRRDDLMILLAKL